MSQFGSASAGTKNNSFSEKNRESQHIKFEIDIEIVPLWR